MNIPPEAGSFYKTSTVAYAILFSLMLIAIVSGVLLLGEKKEEPTEPTCEVVDGNTHLNRGQCLSDDYKPQNIVPLSTHASWLDTKQYLDVRAAYVVENVIRDAQELGLCLVVSSGYRTPEEQKKLKDESDHKELVADPNASEHQTGLAIDFVACPMSEGVRNDSVERPELADEFNTLPEYKWLVKNAYKYDLEQSYTVENIADTQYPVESWHWKLIIK